MVVDSPPGMMRPSMAFGTGEFGRSADELRGGAEGGEDFGVGVVGALQGEDTDGQRCRHCSHFTWRGLVEARRDRDLKKRLPSMREELIQYPFSK